MGLVALTCRRRSARLARSFTTSSTSCGEKSITSPALRCEVTTDHVVLDAATQINLELVASRGARDTSLLAVLDRTVTPMGGRKLRSWILQPLRTLVELERRLQLIADLLQESDLHTALRSELKAMRDIERAVGRLSQASGNARDLVALKTSLQQIPKLKAELQKLIERARFGTGRDGSPSHSLNSSADQSLAEHLQNDIREMPELAAKLNGAIN